MAMIDHSPPTQRSRLPGPHNPMFTGLEDQMRSLYDAVVWDGGSEWTRTKTSRHVISGPPGSGKTELAREFVQRHGGLFGAGVFWIDCHDVSTLREQIQACAGERHLALPAVRGDVVRAVRETWKEKGPKGTTYLIVLDGVRPVDLNRWQLVDVHGAVLITTRAVGSCERSGLSGTVLGWRETTLSPGMSADDAVALLCAVAGPQWRDQIEETAHSIVDALGCHPHAVALAGRWLCDGLALSARGLADELERFGVSHPALRRSTPMSFDSPLAYPGDLVQVLHDALVGAVGLGEATELLAVIGDEVRDGRVQKSEVELGLKGVVDADFQGVLDQLVDLGFLYQRGPGVLGMHVLVADYLARVRSGELEP
jgi:hypothetical protein